MVDASILRIRIMGLTTPEVPHHGGRSPSPARCFMSSPGAVAVLLDVDVHQGLDASCTSCLALAEAEFNF